MISASWLYMHYWLSSVVSERRIAAIPSKLLLAIVEVYCPVAVLMEEGAAAFELLACNIMRLFAADYLLKVN